MISILLEIAALSLSLAFFIFCVYGFFNTARVIYLWQKWLFDWESSQNRRLYEEVARTSTFAFGRRFLRSLQAGPEALGRNHRLYVEATRFLFFVVALFMGLFSGAALWVALGG